MKPSPIHVSDDVLTDLRERLARTRWPDDAGNRDWSYGVDRAYLQELCEYWLTKYNWRKAEAGINAYEHYHVSVDGVPVHFMRHGAGGTPLILSHGWPWTFWHWSKEVEPLAARGFDVIVPSLPGFGF